MYRVDADSEALDQIAALPDVALAGYAEALGVMKLIPWNGDPINETNPGGAVRQLVFGPEGRGIVTYSPD